MIAEVYPEVTSRNGKYSPEQVIKKEAFEKDFFESGVGGTVTP